MYQMRGAGCVSWGLLVVSMGLGLGINMSGGFLAMGTFYGLWIVHTFPRLWNDKKV